jgi:LemA protein
MESLFILIVPLGAILLLAGIVVISIYNGLVNKRNMVRNAFSTIDVMLKKRHDLIPNLVETVKAFAAHEKDTFERVIALRNQATDPAISESERLKVEGRIGQGLGRLLAISEDYPELKSSDQFLNLQRNLTEIEEQISAARRSFNGAVMGINNSVESFPSNIIAAKFGFERHDFFEGDETIRQSISVDL